MGTCLSVGCTVNGISPKDITAQVNSGELVCSKWLINIIYNFVLMLRIFK